MKKVIDSNMKLFNSNLKFFSQKSKYLRVAPAAVKYLQANKLKIEDLPIPDTMKILTKEFLIHFQKNKGKEIPLQAKKEEDISAKTSKPALQNPKIENPIHTEKINEKSKETVIPVQIPEDLIKNNEFEKFSFRNSLPQIYFKSNIDFSEIIAYLELINKKNKDKITLSDFFAKVASQKLSKNPNFLQIYNYKLNKFVKSENILVYVKEINKDFSVKEYIYENAHKKPLYLINDVKKDIKDLKGSFIPVFRIFNYSELNVSNIDESIIPPTIHNLNIGKAKKIVLADSNNQIQTKTNSEVSFISVATLFDENEFSEFFDGIKNIIENPLRLSL